MISARQLARSVLVAASLLAVVPTVAASSQQWPGKPGSPPPKLGTGTIGPPPAWVESRTRAWWLAYSSYCWKTSCVDFLPPQSRPNLPLLSVRRGSPMRLHLGFRPRELSITTQSGSTRTTLKAPVAQVFAFTPTRGGILIVSARSANVGGSGSYVARLHVA